LFDATAYIEKGEVAEVMSSGLSIVYPQDLWGVGNQRDLPSNDVIARAVKKRAAGREWVVFDIESWPLDGDEASASASIRKFRAVLEAARKADPDARFGIYGEIPRTDYAASTSPQGSPRYLAWQQRNDRVRELVDSVDALFPSLYTQFRDPAQWRRHAEEEVREARRVASGKPVYPFIWPEYHPASKLFGQEIDSQFWGTQLVTLCRVADGAVIWGGWDLKANKARVWSNGMPWWRATISFRRAHPGRCD
jgi:hypothetical protein